MVEKGIKFKRYTEKEKEKILAEVIFVLWRFNVLARKQWWRSIVLQVQPYWDGRK